MITAKKKLIACACFVAILSILLPLAQIIKYENVIQNGTSYKFKLEAYDPYDPFMGRYLRIQATTEIPKTGFVADGDNYYHKYNALVEIEVKENGETKFVKVVEEDKMESGKDYIKCHISERSWQEGDTRPAMLRITLLNVDRYYMNEELALPAENAFREALRGGAECYIVLKILGIKSVPQQIYIGDKRIEDFVRENSSN